MCYLVVFSEYRDEIYEKYREFLEGLPPKGTEEYHRLRQPIMDFNEQLDSDHNSPETTLKSVVARMFAAKNQFTGLVTILTSYDCCNHV